MSTKFIAVTGARSLREVNAYLYGYAGVIASGEEGDGRVWATVKVETERDDVDYLAEYQAGRYASGWIGARVCNTPQEAELF